MDPLLASLIEPFAQRGTSRFSGWNAVLFQAYSRAIFPSLWQNLKLRSVNAEQARAVLSAYAHLVCEGVGNGYLATGPQSSPGNLMEYCLRDWLMPRLGLLPPEQQLTLLADTWNLLEGLLREPRWVNAYALARAGELDQESSLASFLTRVLRPLFEPVSSAKWEGPFQVHLISTRAGHDEFLPGDMRLIAPTILAVQDRRRNVHLGFILRKQGQTELAGTFSETAAFVEEASAVVPRWAGSSLSFGTERITLPFLHEPFRWLQVRAGFVVASAINSQKLWIVESAT